MLINDIFNMAASQSHDGSENFCQLTWIVT